MRVTSDMRLDSKGLRLRMDLEFTMGLQLDMWLKSNVCLELGMLDLYLVCFMRMRL